MVDGGSTLGSSRRPGLLLSSFWESFWVRKDMICDVLLETQGGEIESGRGRKRKREKKGALFPLVFSCLRLSLSTPIEEKAKI